jgi:D-beta-D-heptose 7-phosphate kinase/D-beta-D-heptose 1-phosphate adenosyltransferase
MFVERVIQRLEGIVNSFPQKTIVGVGDLMLDQYRRGKAVVLSPEAPVIDLHNPSLTEVPGGAANAAWNVGLLGGFVHLIGVVGRDPEADSLRKLMAVKQNVNLIGIEDSSRPTTTKLRYCNNQFHLLRISNESKDSIGTGIFEECKNHIHSLLPKTNAIFIQDYDKGVVRGELMNFLLEIRAQFPQMIIALDPKPSNEKNYRPGMFSLLKPNWWEACALAKVDAVKTKPEEVAQILSDKYQCDVIVTLGPDGSVIHERATNVTAVIPTQKAEAFDLTGAGDTILAASVLALTSGASLVEAAFIANIVGGIGVRKAGTCVATYEELLAQIADPENRHLIAKFTEELVRQESLQYVSQTETV